MAWETRPYKLQPNEDIMRQTKGGRLLGKRVRVTLDPRAYEAEDANDLRVEGEVLACSSDGPTLFLVEPDNRFALIDVLVIEPLDREVV